MIRGTVLFLALGLGAAHAAPPTPAAPDERVATFAAIDAASDAGLKADLLLALSEDPNKAPLHAEALARLGVLYDQAELDIAAQAAWARAIALDPAAMGPLVGLAIDGAEKLGDEGPLGEALAKAPGFAVDPVTRGRIAEIAGRWALQHDQLGQAVVLLQLGNPDGPNWPEVLSLLGIALASQGRSNDAIAPLQDAIRAGEKAGRDERWLRTQQLNLARTYYAADNFGMAIFHFAEMPRESEWWPEAQFERAWSHFRSEDMAGSLAMLMTLESPFFEDWFYPEADLLRSYSFFMMCKFPEAKKRIDAFGTKYRPIATALDQALPALDDAGLLDEVRRLRAGEATTVPAAMLRTYTHDDRVGDALAFVAEADKELASAAFSGKRAATVAKSWIEARKKARVAEEAKRIRFRLDEARADLKSMLEGIQITGVDITTLEADLYERAAATGSLDFGDPAGRLRKLRKDKTGFHVWPFEGEYWADELGWYQVDDRPDCPDQMAVGGGTSR
jgi:tetratricopeptide (TPR) repeat protein